MKHFKDRWIDQAYQKIKLLYPNDSKDKIKAFLSEEFDNDFIDNSCILYNNYEKDEVTIPLIKMFDWIEERQPILTESGTLFKQHSECFNPNTMILKDKLDERKIKKKEKFKYLEQSEKETDPEKIAECLDKAQKADLAQLRLKIQANSEYGASGLSSSWFFNMACASATTARGQALISTAFNAFEDFLSDNVLFMTMNECLMFVNNIVHEKDKRKKSDKKWVKDKSYTDVYNRLLSKFESEDICDKDVLKRIVKNLSQADLNRVYYKSNMYEFFNDSSRARGLLKSIVLTKVTFLDPEKPPEEIKKYLNKLRPAVLEYVHYNYPTFNRVLRLKTHIRKSVIVIDTDSNFINLGPWVEYVRENIINNITHIKKSKNNEGKTIIHAKVNAKSYFAKDKQQENFRIIYTMIHIMNTMISDTLETFKERSNIKPGHPGVLNMKNEFLYDTVLVTPAKKHYQAAIRVQEGVYFEKPKMDIKGELHAPIVSDNYM